MIFTWCKHRFLSGSIAQHTLSSKYTSGECLGCPGLGSLPNFPLPYCGLYVLRYLGCCMLLATILGYMYMWCSASQLQAKRGFCISMFVNVNDCGKFDVTLSVYICTSSPSFFLVRVRKSTRSTVHSYLKTDPLIKQKVLCNPLKSDFLTSRFSLHAIPIPHFRARLNVPILWFSHNR